MRMSDGPVPDGKHEESPLPAPQSNEAARQDYALAEKTYLDHRACLNEIELKSADQHDKAILQLTIAALGVSITFLDRIAHNQPVPTSRCLLVGSWLSLGLSIFAILGSFLTSQRACQEDRKHLDDDFRNRKVTEFKNKYKTITTWLNRIAYTSFLIGVSLLLGFSYANLPTGNGVNDTMQSPNQNTGTQQQSTRGSVPPSVPVPATQSPSSPSQSAPSPQTGGK